MTLTLCHPMRQNRASKWSVTIYLVLAGGAVSLSWSCRVLCTHARLFNLPSRSDPPHDAKSVVNSDVPRPAVNKVRLVQLQCSSVLEPRLKRYLSPASALRFAWLGCTLVPPPLPPPASMVATSAPMPRGGLIVARPGQKIQLLMLYHPTT
ncbi:hypothetical protein BCV69DRAFT_115839 [Microstroma glucosiphilum]|uniref:Uncharacterized protein n=1 Tax=Pseudomicrostroma glucosiphilum TaxID=1684307 RepID=A0A316UDS7_9BASI|nr:hypothetical protein BCV69DRAFT_115839 [Pseudomicrostroma glucosiphilum]PWN23322.1 hypothetical protein BCV69DRAFT_115839 [Pseudomicrostroma glucosiphilum]